MHCDSRTSYTDAFLLLYWHYNYSEFKQVAVDVEREEDEGGTAGETFIDYVRY